MDLFHTSFELQRIVFLLGAVIALLWKKQFGVTPGGIIIPGILALLLDTSALLFSSVVANAVLVWLIYKLAFANFALSQRWASLITMSLSVCLSLVTIYFGTKYQLVGQEILALSAIAPGLIALAARKYQLGPALHHTLAATTTTYAAGWVLAATLPHIILTGLNVELAAYKPLALDNLYLTMLMSMATAVVTYAIYKTRSGGYMIAPFLAIVLLGSPIQAVLLAVGVGLCYAIVRAVQRITLIIGLERFVLSLFASYLIISLIDLLASHIIIPGYFSAPIILMVAMAVLTNDLCLQPLRQTLHKGFSPALATATATRLVTRLAA